MHMLKPGCIPGSACLQRVLGLLRASLGGLQHGMAKEVAKLVQVPMTGSLQLSKLDRHNDSMVTSFTGDWVLSDGRGKIGSMLLDQGPGTQGSKALCNLFGKACWKCMGLQLHRFPQLPS